MKEDSCIFNFKLKRNNKIIKIRLKIICNQILSKSDISIYWFLPKILAYKFLSKTLEYFIGDYIIILTGCYYNKSKLEKFGINNIIYEKNSFFILNKNSLEKIVREKPLSENHFFVQSQYMKTIVENINNFEKIICELPCCCNESIGLKRIALLNIDNCEINKILDAFNKILISLIR